MRKTNPKRAVKILILLLVAGLIVLSAKNIYDSLSRAGRVNEELVEPYRPHLDVELVKKAAEILRSTE